MDKLKTLHARIERKAKLLIFVHESENHARGSS